MTVEPPGRDAEMRRRAAWLLGMLALVAALFVALMVTFLNGSDGDPNPDNVADPTDLATSTSSASVTRPAPTTSRTSGSSDSSSDGSSDTTGPTDTGAPATGGSTGSRPDTSGPKTCPTAAACAFDTDIGDAVTAINAYRTKNGRSAVPGSVSEAAKQCALTKGSGCTGGWAETQLDAPNGTLAVQKIMQYAKFLDDVKAIQIGWAYDPAEKRYDFAIIRVE